MFKKLTKKETFLNKIFALALIICGIIPILLEGNGTVLILLLVFAIPLLLSKENHILL